MDYLRQKREAAQKAVAGLVRPSKHVDPTAEPPQPKEEHVEEFPPTQEVPTAVPTPPKSNTPDPARIPVESPSSRTKTEGGPVPHTYAQPQWVGGEVATAQNSAVTGQSRPPCATCNKRYWLSGEDCVCTACNRCGCSIRLKRHHCRKCALPVCSSCRLRTRQLILGVGNYLQEPTCHECSLRPALLFLLTEPLDLRRPGLLLLLEASDPARRCIDSAACGTYTYRDACPRCHMPTTTQGLYADRSIVIRSGAMDAVRRTQTLNNKAKEIRQAAFESFTNKNLIQALGTMAVPRFHERPGTNLRLLLGLTCAGLCYEYAAYGHITLTQHLFPFTSALRLVSSEQLYSVFEVPGKVRFVAFPGTHDARTGYTDVKFARTDVVVMKPLRMDGGVHGGFATVGRYRAHTGFLTEANKVYLPEVLDWIRDGYDVVYCGHSLGGAISTLATVNMLTTHCDVVRNSLMCVTAGAPMVGNYELRDLMASYGAFPMFHHFVYRGDIVPRLLMGREAPQQMLIVAQATLAQAHNTLAQAHATLVNAKETAKQAIVDSRIGGYLFKKKEKETTTPPPDTLEPPTESQPAPGETAPVVHVEEVPEVIPEVIPSKRSFEYFGTYHLMSVQGCMPYVTTSDSEQAYAHLSHGLRQCTANDHFMDTYANALIRHAMYGQVHVLQ